MSGAFQNNSCDPKEARNVHRDKVSLMLTHFLLYFIQIIIITIIITLKHIPIKEAVVSGVLKSHSSPLPKRLPLKTRLCACLGKVGSTLQWGLSSAQRPFKTEPSANT